MSVNRAVLALYAVLGPVIENAGGIAIILASRAPRGSSLRATLIAEGALAFAASAGAWLGALDAANGGYVVAGSAWTLIASMATVGKAIVFDRVEPLAWLGFALVVAGSSLVALAGGH